MTEADDDLAVINNLESHLTAEREAKCKLEAELNLIADCLEGKAPAHIAFADHPHAHNARLLEGRLSEANAKMEKLRKKILSILNHSQSGIDGPYIEETIRQILANTEKK